MDKRTRLLAHVGKVPGSECWQWQSQVSNSGFGRIMLRDNDGKMRMQSAHRASYATFVGSLPEEKKVVQTCGNRLCINPAHLQLQDI
jgi:hypothetical protein